MSDYAIPSDLTVHQCLCLIYEQDILPEVERQGQRLYRVFRRYDLAAEALQEARALSWLALLRWTSPGGGASHLAQVIARRAICRALRGHRFRRRQRRKDTGHDIFDPNYGDRNRPLAVQDGAGPRTEATAALTASRQSDPARTVPVRLDWAAWTATLSRTDRRFLAALSEGYSARAAARWLGRGDSWASETRRRLHTAWRYYCGDES